MFQNIVESSVFRRVKEANLYKKIPMNYSLNVNIITTVSKCSWNTWPRSVAFAYSNLTLCRFFIDYLHSYQGQWLTSFFISWEIVYPLNRTTFFVSRKSTTISFVLLNDKNSCRKFWHILFWCRSVSCSLKKDRVLKFVQKDKRKE